MAKTKKNDRPVAAGELVNCGRNDDVEMVPARDSCGSESHGYWHCATHRYTARHNLDMNSHCEERGEHVRVWLCAKHGPEVP